MHYRNGYSEPKIERPQTLDNGKLLGIRVHIEKDDCTHSKANSEAIDNQPLIMFTVAYKELLNLYRHFYLKMISL